ncbi:MAG: FeoB small GTPase domain-containing protein [Akkermansia sp.]|nr:FeoB small GTPase domain-containing protein [Akkermansia sp.]
MKKRIALAGNPNSGKTSLFNDLTGANQYVGNWPGVTVDRKGGELKEHEEVEIQDLPGTYSLSPFSPEEVVSRNYLLEEKPDMVVNVVDATNLERNLYLTGQIIETGLPVVIALNMIDLVEERGESVDAEALSARLGCPVVKVSAITHEGMSELLSHMLAEPPAPGKPLAYIPVVERAVKEIIERHKVSRFAAVKMLEVDESLLTELSKTERHAIEDMRMAIEAETGDDIASVIAGGRYDAICEFIPQVYTRKTTKESFTRRADRILTHRIFGPIIFVAIMYAIYYISINTVGDWGTGWANDVLFGPVVGGWLAGFIGNEVAGVEALTMFSAVLAMVLVFPSMLRRLHDIGMNGAWLYIMVAPFLLEYVCPHLPDILHTGIMWLLLAANAVLLILCFVKPGQKKANDYGSSTRSFSHNPMKMTGRGGRSEFVTWFIVMSLLAFGTAMLGRCTLSCSPQLQSIITDGIVAGVGAVLGFLPQMAVLFFLMALLEDCGYMARVAFMLDRLFRTIGLSGKSVIPLMVSMGCGVPGVMATRTIENEKDRRMTVMLTTFVPCGAKLPILALIGAMLGQTASIATLAYFAGFASVILGGLMLRKTHMFAGSYTPFVMELPAYHLPHGANINLRAMERCKAFVKKAGTVIFLASALIWTLSNYSWNFSYLPEQKGLEGDPINHSMLADTGNTFAPLFAPLGWGDWRPAVATVTGLIAKENVVGTFGVLYPAPEAPAAPESEAAPAEEDALPRSCDLNKVNALTALTMAAWQCDPAARAERPAPARDEEADEEESAVAEEPAADKSWLDYVNAVVAYLFPEVEEDDETTGVAANVKATGAFTSLSALSFMLFNILCAPCFAACGAIRREMNSARWTGFAIAYMCLWAYVVAFLVYQLGLWITEGTFASAQVLACALTLGLLYMAVRRNPHEKENN